MNYWMFAMISIGCIFIVFVGVSIYILWYPSSTILSNIVHQQVKCERQEDVWASSSITVYGYYMADGAFTAGGIGIAGSKKLKGECNAYNFLKCCDVSLQVYQKGTFLTIVF